jgi:hypothetical protein
MGYLIGCDHDQVRVDARARLRPCRGNRLVDAANAGVPSATAAKPAIAVAALVLCARV